MTKKALICGISGQDGAWLAQMLLEKGYEVFGTSRDAQVSMFGKLRALGIRDQVEIHSMAPNDFRSVLQTISRVEPDEVYNLGGQSSVGLSFQQPVETLESIAVATLNLLEVIRFLGGPTRLYNAGSGECFGNTAGVPANENTPFRPRSPYAVAKASAHWEVANYREAYDLFACTGILFNHESQLRPRRFVTRKIVSAAVEIAAGKRDTVNLGNLKVKRDWGWAPEYVEAMWRMLQRDQPDDYVIATGQTNSLEDFCAFAFETLGLDWRQHVQVDKQFFRPSDIEIGLGDPGRAQRELGWSAATDMRGVVRKMIAAEQAAAQ